MTMLGLTACEDADAVQPVLVAGEDLFSVGYSYGGGMDGGTDSISLTRDGRGALLEWSRQETWDAREKKGRARLDAAAFDEFERIALEYDLRAASERPDSEFQALDAATSSITFAYVDEDGETDVDGMFTVSSTQDLDKRQTEGFWTAIDALKALVK